MILPIYTYGQPVLRKVAEDIDANYPELKQLVENMYETNERADGVGLAAPQIGLPIRVVIVDLRPLGEDMPEYADFKRAYINGYIVEEEGETILMDEGCLSLPGIHEKVPRAERVCNMWMRTSWSTMSGSTDSWPACCNMSLTIWRVRCLPTAYPPCDVR